MRVNKIARCNLKLNHITINISCSDREIISNWPATIKVGSE